jgi:hypothetical protein
MMFHHHVSLGKIDPLGDGLREMIEAEQLEPEAITLEETPDGQSLSEQWQNVVAEVENDPEWFNFAGEDD